MRKLSLKAELIMPMDNLSASEMDLVVGGTATTTTPMTPQLHLTPQRLDNIKQGLNSGWCPPPPVPTVHCPTQVTCQSVCNKC